MTDGAGLAIWPKGRLAGLEAPREGRFSTVAFIPPRRRISVNASVPPTGKLRVGLHKLNGECLPGREIEHCDALIGDSVAHVLSWNGQTDIGAAEGEPIFIEFRLNQAKLFAVNYP